VTRSNNPIILDFLRQWTRLYATLARYIRVVLWACKLYTLPSRHRLLRILFVGLFW